MKQLNNAEKRALIDATCEYRHGRCSLPTARELTRTEWAKINAVPISETLSYAEIGELNDIIQTNAALQRSADAMHFIDTTQPAAELLVKGDAGALREWGERWHRAATAVNWQGVATDGTPRAYLLSPVWRELSRWGYPYPPFDFGATTLTREVDYETALNLGLLNNETFIDELEEAGEHIPPPDFVLPD